MNDEYELQAWLSEARQWCTIDSTMTNSAGIIQRFEYLSDKGTSMAYRLVKITRTVMLGSGRGEAL